MNVIKKPACRAAGSVDVQRVGHPDRRKRSLRHGYGAPDCPDHGQRPALQFRPRDTSVGGSGAMMSGVVTLLLSDPDDGKEKFVLGLGPTPAYSRPGANANDVSHGSQIAGYAITLDTSALRALSADDRLTGKVRGGQRRLRLPWRKFFGTDGTRCGCSAGVPHCVKL